MSGLVIDPICPEFGARVIDADLQDLNADCVRDLNAALDRYGVLVFPNQKLSEADQISFAKVFGTPSERSRPADCRAEQSEYAHLIGLVTNVRENGEPIGSLPDGEMWLHHDGCFIDEPYRATLLYALHVTSTGGETRFVDMRQVYRDLPTEIQSELIGKTAVHQFDYRNINARPQSIPSSGSAREAEHPVVIKHPRTSEPALYVNPLCTIQFSDAPNNDLLDQLFRAIEENAATFHHRWSVDDLVIWDNWSSCHARSDFPAAEKRMLRRCIIKGCALDAH